MQFKNFFHLLILSILFFVFPNQSQAQEIQYNRHGERIVKFPSGKWEYYDESKPLHRAIWKEYKIQNDIADSDLDEQTSKGADSNQIQYEILLEEAEEELAMAQEEESDAKFSKILHENKIAYRLKEGEVLIFDQTKMVHGRNALGAQQNLLNSNNRRLLFQIYGTDTK